MPSRAIYASEWAKLIDNNELQWEAFERHFLVEGDSWMDRSSLKQVSLPPYLAQEIDAAGGPSTLIVSLARFGDTMRRIGQCADEQFADWVRETSYDAILLSAAGNDFIDAARDPDAGQGILHNMQGQPLPAQGYDCVDHNAVARLVGEYLDPNFQRLIDIVRAGQNDGVPLFLNNYDTPVARPAPALSGGDAWLYKAYTKNGIDPTLWEDLTAGVFNDIQTTIGGWAKQHAGVHVVPTDGTLIAAASGSTGSSGDWLNEIHPNQSGWRKLARVWRETIFGVI